MPRAVKLVLAAWRYPYRTCVQTCANPRSQLQTQLTATVQLLQQRSTGIEETTCYSSACS
eukprot:1495167-Amphidinium_carterae.1